MSRAVKNIFMTLRFVAYLVMLYCNSRICRAGYLVSGEWVYRGGNIIF